MGIKVANNAFATLAAGISNSATSITVASGQGARFPVLGAGDYFYATLINTSNQLEIVKCTARSGDVLTVERAQEATTARAYDVGDRIEIRITAATFEDATSEYDNTTSGLSATTTQGAIDELADDLANFEAIPSGAVQFFAMNAAPTGWLKANGAAVSRSTYAALFAAIGTTFGAGDGSTTFGLPDLRGEFPRGWDDGRAVDTGRAFGSAQSDAFQGHRHAIKLFAGTAVFGPRQGDNVPQNDRNNGVLDPISDGVNGAPRTAAETRPRNIALLACIKF
jgi:phage-related tail fiber protein